MTPPQISPGSFPSLNLPLPIPYPPMEATRVDSLPQGEQWQFEPKWDGFRCLVFREGEQVILQSKAGQPLSRYFPELIEAFQDLASGDVVLDGEIVILRDGTLSFDDLLLRIHPAESRVRRLASETPASFIAFDLLYSESEGLLVEQPLKERRKKLERFFAEIRRHRSIRLSPVTEDRGTAEQWFHDLGPLGLDGVMAKVMTARYRSGERDAMLKVKLLKTADCVVGGYRYAREKSSTGEKERKKIGSLLLGLYDEEGIFHFVGFTSSFKRDERIDLMKTVEPLRARSRFTGRAPGGPSRWARSEDTEWEPVDPVLVCEVQYDYFSQGRFRHGTKFLRWRPEKRPEQCTMDQVQRTSSTALADTIFKSHLITNPSGL